MRHALDADLNESCSGFAGHLMADNKAGSSTVIGLIAVAIAVFGFAMLFIMAWA
jgi:hypothetical protein